MLKKGLTESALLEMSGNMTHPELTISQAEMATTGLTASYLAAMLSCR